MSTVKLKPVAALTIALAASASAAGVKVGQPAPDLALKLVDGREVRLADLRGKVVVLNFWATWCVPCRQELPTLDAYYTLQQRAGLRVFAVTTEDSLPAYQLKKLFAVMHIPPARSMKGPYSDNVAVPTNYVIDRAGTIRYAKAGALDLDSLNATLVPLLKEPAPAGTSAS